MPLRGVGPSEGIYAPTLRFHEGVFYLVTTNVTRGGNFLVHSTDPARGWSDLIWLGQGGIDPSLLFDGGNVYLTTTNTGGAKHEMIPPEAGRYGIVQSVIDLRTGQLLARPRYLWSGTGGRCPEGPHLYKIGPFYYLLVAEGGTEYGHRVNVARSETPWGPFEGCPHNPILSHRSLEHPVQGTGHGDLVEAHDGSWWLVLSFRPHGYAPCYHLGRETFLAPVRWTPDGPPVVGEGGTVGLVVEADTLPPHPWPEPASRDDFDAAQLGLVWNTLRDTQPQGYSLSERPGWLALRGSPLTLDDYGDDHDTPALVGRRQQHFEVTAEARLEFSPRLDTEEAGLVVRMTEGYPYDLAVSRRPGRRCVFVRRRVGSLLLEAAHTPLPPGSVVLILEADSAWYSFGYRLENGPTHWLTRGETKFLSAEVAGSFLGVYMGMYATGNGRNVTRSAFFDPFDYRPR